MTTPVGRFARPRRALVISAIAVAVGLAGATLPASSASAAPTPAKPSGVRVVAVGDSGFTVKLRASARAKKYRVWASTTKGRLALSTIRRTDRSRTVRKPRVRISGLRYSSAPYYFRVQAIGRGTSRYSAVYRTSLRTATPSGLRISSSRTAGVALQWGGRPAARYQVQQATDGRMSRGARTWSTRSVAQTFSPHGLAPGTRYWFRVRATNGSSTSGWSRAVSATALSRGLTVRAMTYNVLKAEMTGTKLPSGARVAAWSTRRGQIIQNVRSSRAQVVGLQEAAGWTNKDPRSSGPGVRQADDVRNALGGRWTVATTEPRPGDAGWKRTGRYVLFDGARFSQTAAGTWQLVGGANPTKAAWAVLTDRATGARMIAVSAHLYPSTGSANDRRRKTETERLVGLVNRARSTYGAQAFYLGDFNSAPDKKHPLDGPGVAFRAARVVKADQGAASLSSTARYNTNNQGYAPGPAKAVHVDAIWAPAGVGVRSWWMVPPTRGRVIPSDHNPVVADLVLPY